MARVPQPRLDALQEERRAVGRHRHEPSGALATAFLAWTTRSEVRASRDEVAISRQALQTSIRPLLVDAQWHLAPVELSFFSGSNEKGEPFGAATCNVPLFNVGAGLTLIEEFELRGLNFRWEGRTRQTAVPSGECAWFDFSAEIDPGDAAMLRDTAPSQDEESLELHVSYSDLDGAGRESREGGKQRLPRSHQERYPGVRRLGKTVSLRFGGTAALSVAATTEGRECLKCADGGGFKTEQQIVL